MMPLCLKIEKQKAEALRRMLLSKGLLDTTHEVSHDLLFVYFPVTGKPQGKFSYVQKTLKKRAMKPFSLKEALANKLTAAELDSLVSSFDIIGSIAIIEIPDSLKKCEKEIAKAVMAVHHSVKTVAKKLSAMEGVFRVRKLKIIAGKKTLETEYHENGARMLLDVGKVYFSPRLATERKRIAEQVKPNEKVLVMFAGVGPFALVIAKKQPSAKIAAVELNPAAVKYMQKNIVLNKAANVAAIREDVRHFAKKLRGWAGGRKGFADRIAMPLPHSADRFLDCAFECAKKGCVVHFYSIAHEGNPFAEAEEKVKEEAKKAGRKVAILNRHIVRPYAPHVVQAVLDFRVA